MNLHAATQAIVKIHFADLSEDFRNELFTKIAQRYYGRDNYENRFSTKGSIEEWSAMLSTVLRKEPTTFKGHLIVGFGSGTDKTIEIILNSSDYVYQTHTEGLMDIEEYLQFVPKVNKTALELNDLPLIVNRHTPPPMLMGSIEERSIYIGRGTAYGNPFQKGGCNIRIKGLSLREYIIADREHAVLMFDRYLEDRPELISQARQELYGHNLTCSCAPLSCHAMSLFAQIYSDGHWFGRDTYFERKLLLQKYPPMCPKCNGQSAIKDWVRQPARWQCKNKQCQHIFHAEPNKDKVYTYYNPPMLINVNDSSINVADRHYRNIEMGLRKDRYDNGVVWVCVQADNNDMLYYY